MPAQLAQRVHELLADDDEGRLCKDIPESACKAQPGNFLRHVLALIASKTGDGLADPKLVLAWLLSTIGAPAFAIGMLVPVREAGSLLPQLAIAGLIRRQARRKWIWAVGSAGQGLAVLGMAAAVTIADGRSAGWIVIALLAVFALCRGACSVSYKDVLGKTVAKASRGSATGAAGSVAALLVLLFGVSLSLGWIPRTPGSMAIVLALAGVLWILAAVVFVALDEAPGAAEGGVSAVEVLRGQFLLLLGDRKLQHFILVRALLLGTALAPPYLLLMMSNAGAGAADGGAGIGPFVVASSLAAVSSAYVWGRMSDASSRRVLVAAALLAASALALAVGLPHLPSGGPGGEWVQAVIFFLLMVSHQGVRLGRSTHIVDMADEARRADFTALSNSAIGVLLLAASGFGLLAETFGAKVVLLIFAAMSAFAALAALGLDEVQQGQNA